MNPLPDQSEFLPFIVRIGTKDRPRLDFAVMGASSARVFEQHVDLAEVDERVEIVAVRDGRVMARVAEVAS